MQWLAISGALAGVLLGRFAWQRYALSRAKHPSLAGHARLARWLARRLPYYGHRAPHTLSWSSGAVGAISDVRFTQANRVPFQFREVVAAHLPTGITAQSTRGPRVQDLDGNESLDLGGSYGVNLLGHEFYKRNLRDALDAAEPLGPLLGPYHPQVADNVSRLRAVSGLDEVSFHMSGTEAIMQAVRLARYHTRKSKIVVFCGAYHGWWDGVQPGVGNPLGSRDIFTLRDCHDATLRVLRRRHDIACVLVNPLQVLHPNRGAGSDAMLLHSGRSAGADRAAYTRWLRELRAVCSDRGIVLIFDEVFVGFRLGLHGAQGYFGVAADLVTYGKTLGGGLPVGVLCGTARLMKRFRGDRPTDICFARGTFNAHPYVMTAMNGFLRHVMSDEDREGLDTAESVWDARFRELDRRLAEGGHPVTVRNLSSVAILLYNRPSRFNWMYQFYLRAEGLHLGWLGTGRLIFSHDYTDADFDTVCQRILAAAERMRTDGWWLDEPALTNREIVRRVVRELIVRGFGRKRPA